MSGKSVSKTGKTVSEGNMTTVALQRALSWHDELMDHFHRGRRDKESAARSRLSEESGVSESYLFRLTHKRRDMREVPGEVYRLLELAHAKYIGFCERNEEAADAYRAERMELKAKRNAGNLEPSSEGVGTTVPRD